MSRAVFKSDRRDFLRKNGTFKEMVLAHAAQDVETQVKIGGKTPFRKGGLRTQTRHMKISADKYRVEVPVEYAAVQEAGRRRGARTFSNYTTSGTGAGFFKDAIAAMLRGVDGYVDQAKKLAGF